MADQIRIGDVTPRVRYVADGATSLFSYPFLIFSAANLEVYVDGGLKAIEVDYQVEGVGNRAGGTLSMNDAPALGASVTLVRRLTIERMSDFATSGDFKADVINGELDFQAAVLQQLDDDLGRSVRLGVAEQDAGLTLMVSTFRAGRVLAFDESGKVVTSCLVDTSAGPLISSMLPTGDTVSGSAGSSTDVSAADHVHPLPAWDDIGIATQAEAEAGTDGQSAMTPLRTAQAMTAMGRPKDALSRDMAATALAYAMASADTAALTGSIGVFNLADMFVTDSLETATNATYDASGNFYYNPGTVSETDAVPAMTGYTTSGVTMTESGTSPSFQCWRLFDNAGDGAASRWAAASNSNQWFTIDFGTPTAIAAYRLRPRNIDSNDLPMAPTSFHLDGWNGSDWDILDSRAGVSWGSHVFKEYSVSAPVAYSKYRFYGVSNSSGYEISLGEMELFALNDPPEMTLLPQPANLSSADPLDVIGYFIFAPVDNVTLGVDLVGEVSIDGGTTFATGTWSTLGDVGSDGRVLYRLDTDVSGQTGSTLVYRLTTANSKQLRLHGCIGLVALY